MKVKLEDLELPQVQEVKVYQRRSLVEHKAPGMAGSLYQNLGRHSAGIFLWGIASGPQALSFVEKLDARFRASAPARFTADVIAGAGVSQVFIADLRFQDLAGKPQRFAYALALREFIKPSKAEDQAALNAGIRAQGQRLARNQAVNLTKRK
jgi:hypothetical protein